MRRSTERGSDRDPDARSHKSEDSSDLRSADDGSGGRLSGAMRAAVKGKPSEVGFALHGPRVKGAHSMK